MSVTASWLQPKSATDGAIQRMSKDDSVMGYCVAGVSALTLKAGSTASVKLTGAAALVAGAVTGLAASLF